ncbi:MAG: hypothetical protein RI883_1259 [Bacteroidota bacterium]|jgi:hypothetical protein
MKKIYTLVATALVCSNLTAQTVIDFENVVLNPETYDNGYAGSSNFQMAGFTFSNFYDAVWGSWNGFSISNITNNTTAGWGNQYSAFPGSGRNSTNYGVYYPEGSIQGNSSLAIDSFFISNTTYAAISMRDGDGIGKQFGSIYAGDGTTVDGTNGEDFYRVWVIAEGYSGVKDSVEIYLADYRFADNSQDYIVDSWIKVDLSTFGIYPYLISFRIESSDVGAWGINTPTYFAIDDVYKSPIQGIAENTILTMDVYPNPVQDLLTVKGENGILTLKDINGKTILSEDHFGISILNFEEFPAGIYFLELINSNGIAVQKIIK